MRSKRKAGRSDPGPQAVVRFVFCSSSSGKPLGLEAASKTICFMVLNQYGFWVEDRRGLGWGRVKQRNQS